MNATPPLPVRGVYVQNARRRIKVNGVARKLGFTLMR
jgi:hypothetical protein